MPPRIEAVRAALAEQIGTILQKPPEYSALKIGGRRAYDRARAGEPVDLAPRPVTIHRIDVCEYDWPRLELEVECGGGTYIRAIARDLGDLLGCGGLVASLLRTAIGPFTLETAIDPMTLGPESVPGLLRPALEAVASLRRVELSQAHLADIAQGRTIPLPERIPAGEVALIGPDGALAAIAYAEPVAGRVAPLRVIARTGRTSRAE
jgi:tRNA pseudouridine55 synthase